MSAGITAMRYHAQLDWFLVSAGYLLIAVTQLFLPSPFILFGIGAVMDTTSESTQKQKGTHPMSTS
jgi:hypothetical protein